MRMWYLCELCNPILKKLVMTRLKRMNPLGKEVFHAVLRESAHSTFGKYISTTIQQIIYDAFPEKISYRYLVPPALCTAVVAGKPENNSAQSQKQGKEGKQYQLSAGGLLAIFDELSTYPIILEDREYRGGVSVDLFTELLKPVYANEEVYVVTRTDKIGKILGFCTMELLDKNGALLARGKHIKYLPINVILEFFSRFPFLNFTSWVYYTFRMRAYDSPIDKPLGLSDVEVPYPVEVMTPGHVYDHLLPVKLHQDDVDRRVILIDAPDNHHCDDAELYSIRVSSGIKQFLGNLHGGALGACVELASCMYKFSRNPDLQTHLMVKSLDIRYINPMRGEILIKVGDDKFSPQITSTNEGQVLQTHSKSVGYIYNRKNHGVCAEFTCEWIFT